MQSCSFRFRSSQSLHVSRTNAQRRLVIRAAAAAKAASTPAVVKQQLLYDGIALDMDGTLTSCVIDFIDMRKRTGIPVGDLFVAMESWEEPEDIKASMDVILEIEAEASRNISGKEGLMELLQLLADSKAKVALVTRNTTQSVDAFFDLVGQEWRQLFSEIRTREFRYVKPDKRLLLELAETWNIHPGKLLMVGDSHEDVECGNAAGTATCLIAGGGNEVGAANAGPPAGAVPTFSVKSLPELTQFLKNTAPTAANLEAMAAAAAADSSLASSSTDSDPLSSMDWLEPSSIALLGWSLRSGSLDSMSSMSSTDQDDSTAAGTTAGNTAFGVMGVPLDPCSPGAPAPGLDFFDYLVEQGAVKTATTSFPRMGAAAGGLAACPQGGGDSLVHIGCGDGALTKMLASKGLRVFGVDADVAAATKRGLKCVSFQGQPLSQGSLSAAAAVAKGPVDAVLVYTAPQAVSSSSGVATGNSSSSQTVLGSKECLREEAMREFGQLLKPGGRLCIEVPLPAGQDAAAVLTELLQAAPAAGYSAVSSVQVLPGLQQERLRLVADWAG